MDDLIFFVCGLSLSEKIQHLESKSCSSKLFCLSLLCTRLVLIIVGNFASSVKKNCFPTHVICWVHTMICMTVCYIWINTLTFCSAGASQSNRWERLFSCIECTWQTGMWDTSTVAGDWLRNYIDILKGAWRMRGPDGLHLPSQNKLGFLSAVTFKVCIYLCLCVFPWKHPIKIIQGASGC